MDLERARTAQWAMISSAATPGFVDGEAPPAASTSDGSRDASEENITGQYDNRHLREWVLGVMTAPNSVYQAELDALRAQQLQQLKEKEVDDPEHISAAVAQLAAAIGESCASPVVFGATPAEQRLTTGGMSEEVGKKRRKKKQKSAKPVSPSEKSKSDAATA